VMLYTLVMRENPFESIEDTIKASYSIPLDVSIDWCTVSFKVRCKYYVTGITY